MTAITTASALSCSGVLLAARSACARASLVFEPRAQVRHVPPSPKERRHGHILAARSVVKACHLHAGPQHVPPLRSTVARAFWTKMPRSRASPTVVLPCAVDKVSVLVRRRSVAYFFFSVIRTRPSVQEQPPLRYRVLDLLVDGGRSVGVEISAARKASDQRLAQSQVRQQPRLQLPVVRYDHLDALRAHETAPNLVQVFLQCYLAASAV
eukprot:CAMPEP_0198366678 /NCGR_PEP_ID=MMETSP1450-20131203/154798_1 /TAXON_ID=753684 ORGANISM="Madagascaria erythrocladiodes, Strain CCMP3234" /NCGR_SAMPLE_ID=MMETSP1450 /ASSEMBLY_ACC=CAM_ASM_001115 /LENGTH=209 /DNA_ID=CAMNT_0044074145 /DNA_START=365 /DNA_END=996 /DNA_ORIENTATION=+